MASDPLAPDLLDLLDRAAVMPRGLAFLHRAPVEAAAITLRVGTDLVDRLRACIDDGATRPAVVTEFRRARERRRADPRPLRTPPPPSPLAPSEPEELIRAAEAHPLGLGLLVCAPVETAAVLLRAHPFLVLRTRELLAERGVLPEHFDEGGELD